MGHKVHPIGLRLGIVKEWQAKWFAEKEYTHLLHEDLKLREFIRGRLKEAGVPRVEIERSANQVTVSIWAAKPGIVIGKSGARVEQLRQQLEKLTSKKVRLNVQEIRQPEVDAYLVARSIADQLVRRVSYRRAIKQAVLRAMQRGAKGIKVVIAGRLGGAEMSRREREVSGKVPLHTLRADIDYGQAEALTTFGLIGVKVWIYKGDVLPEKKQIRQAPPVEAQPQPQPQQAEAPTAAAGAS
jgi:small subunit ribosomal protein S3